MEIAYFTTKRDPEGDALLNSMKAAVTGDRITTFSDIEKLKDDLKHRVGQKTVVILAALTEEALLDIYCIHYMFYNMPTILILPDKDELFQALAYGMKPNFLFYADSGEENIISVITEMMGETCKMTTINERRLQKGAENFTTATNHYLEDKVSNL